MKTELTPSADENHLAESSREKASKWTMRWDCFAGTYSIIPRRNTVLCATVKITIKSSKIQLESNYLKNLVSLWMIHFLASLHKNHVSQWHRDEWANGTTHSTMYAKTCKLLKSVQQCWSWSIWKRHLMRWVDSNRASDSASAWCLLSRKTCLIQSSPKKTQSLMSHLPSLNPFLCFICWTFQKRQHGQKLPKTHCTHTSH